MPRLPLRTWEEQDAFTGWRRRLFWQRGELKRAKRRHSHRERRTADADIAHAIRELCAIPPGLTRDDTEARVSAIMYQHRHAIGVLAAVGDGECGHGCTGRPECTGPRCTFVCHDWPGAT